MKIIVAILIAVIVYMAFLLYKSEVYRLTYFFYIVIMGKKFPEFNPIEATQVLAKFFFKKPLFIIFNNKNELQKGIDEILNKI